MAHIAGKIMIIRHAEKPTDSGAPRGVASDGTEDPESLTVRGWTRAGALTCLFAPALGRLRSGALETPRVVYASGVGEHSHSRRSQETITPLCERLGLTPATGYLKDQVEEMADDAMSQRGPVLICWEHHVIPVIARRILGDATTAPEEWPDDRFDVVWVFEREARSGGYTFRQVPQRLLAGDDASPIA